MRQPVSFKELRFELQKPLLSMQCNSGLLILVEKESVFFMWSKHMGWSIFLLHFKEQFSHVGNHWACNLKLTQVHFSKSPYHNIIIFVETVANYSWEVNQDIRCLVQQFTFLWLLGNNSETYGVIYEVICEVIQGAFLEPILAMKVAKNVE